MKLPFTINWRKQKATEGQLNYEPLDKGTLQLIHEYSARVLKMLQENVDPSLGFNAHAVRILSDDIDGGRLRYDEEKKNIIGNMYGAFLGTAIIKAHLGSSWKWVTCDGNVGILFNENSGRVPVIAFPITRAFKHIEQGDEYSIYGYFLAIPSSMSSAPKLGG